MTTLQPHTSPAGAGSASRLDLDGRTLPAWPVLVLLWGYPVFWMFGLLPFAQVIMALPMLAFLILRGRIVLVPGVLAWVIFPLWMIPSSLMVDQLGRLTGLAVRCSQFLALAIAIVYIVNARSTLTVRRLLNGLLLIWVFVIFGGYLGMFFPDVRLTFTIGQFLPGFLSSNDYIRDLVFPPLAELQTPWGVEAFNRPSAPFAYTNGWGAAIAVLTPIGVGAILEHKTAGTKLFLVLVLCASIPPAVATTNRGLFVGLAGGVTYVLIRLLLRGRWLSVIWVTTVSAVAYALLRALGLLEEIAARQQAADTTTGRWNLYVDTLKRTLESPVIGFGAPRPSLSSEIYLGTQGAIWNAMFCFGFVGLVLFVAMLLGGVIRTFDAPNPSALWLHTAVVVACLLSLYYGLDRQLVFVGVVLAVLLREKYLGGSTYWTDAPVTPRELRDVR